MGAPIRAAIRKNTVPYLNPDQLKELIGEEQNTKYLIEVQYVWCKNDQIGGLHIFKTICLIIKILYM